MLLQIAHFGAPHSSLPLPRAHAVATTTEEAALLLAPAAVPVAAEQAHRQPTPVPSVVHMRRPGPCMVAGRVNMLFRDAAADGQLLWVRTNDSQHVPFFDCSHPDLQLRGRVGACRHGRTAPAVSDRDGVHLPQRRSALWRNLHQEPACHCQLFLAQLQSQWRVLQNRLLRCLRHG